jgi:hypothetical protein
VRDAICREPPGVKRLREGLDHYNEQLCLYFRAHALVVNDKPFRRVEYTSIVVLQAAAK